jgi:hypothetical protein
MELNSMRRWVPLLLIGFLLGGMFGTDMAQGKMDRVTRVGIFQPPDSQPALPFTWQDNALLMGDDSWQSMRTFRLSHPLRRPIPVYIDVPATKESGYKAIYSQYVRHALDEWSSALEGRLRYTLVATPQEAQIRIYWVAGFTQPDKAGETEFTLEDATVWLKTRQMPDNLLQGNILHELGHALGIAGHSPANDDAMTTGRRWQSRQEYNTYIARLSERDTWAIQRLYSARWQPGEDLYRIQTASVK